MRSKEADEERERERERHGGKTTSLPIIRRQNYKSSQNSLWKQKIRKNSIEYKNFQLINSGYLRKYIVN